MLGGRCECYLFAAAATKTMQGNYYGNAPFLISPEEGLSKYTTVNYTLGCDTKCTDTSGFAGGWPETEVEGLAPVCAGCMSFCA